jgi:hypothetical protein
MADQSTVPFHSTSFTSLLLNRLLDGVEDTTRFEVVSAPANEVEVSQEDTRRVLIYRKNFGFNELLLVNLTAEYFLHRDCTLHDMHVGLKRGGDRIDEGCHVLGYPVWVFFEPMKFGSDDMMHMPLMELTLENVLISNQFDLVPAPIRLFRVKRAFHTSLLCHYLSGNLMLEVVVATDVQIAPLNQANELGLNKHLEPIGKGSQNLSNSAIELVFHLCEELRSRQGGAGVGEIDEKRMHR